MWTKIHKESTKRRESYDHIFKAEFTDDLPLVACAKDISSATWDKSCETLISLSPRWHHSSKINTAKWLFPDLQKYKKSQEG